MATLTKLFIISLLVVSMSNCYSDKSEPPKFIDGGKAMDSIKQVYQAQAIEYENWKDDDLKDSSLSVCIINSPIPPIGNIDSGYTQLVNIARTVNRVVVSPQKYLSYYIIFVKSDTANGVIAKTHTAGSDIPKKSL